MKYIDIKTPLDLYIFMKENIKYGFVNQKDIILKRKAVSDFYYEEELFRNYKFQCAAEVILNKYGLCYDQNELMRYWLESHNYEVFTFYSPIRNHSFLVYKDNDKYIWIETTYKKISGMYEFDSLEDLLKFYITIQGQRENIYEYSNKNYGCNFYDFITFAKNSKLVLKK